MGKESYKPRSGSFPFLALPRSLRDKIYQYVIPFPTAPSAPISSFLDNRPPFELRDRSSELSTDLSILLVNKQIHDEASQILYGETVFPVRVVINESRTDGYEPQTLFEVQYESPWEEVGYTWRDKDDIGEYCAVNFLPRFATHIPENNTPAPLPLPTYRHLIKHLRLDIIDKRVYPYSLKEYDVPAIMQNRIKKLLIPFVHRLASQVGSRKDITLDIKLSSLFLYKEELSNFQYREEAGEETMELYSELIETIWPFTTGPWGYRLDLPLQIQKQHPKLVAHVIKTCDEEYECMEGEEKKRYQTLDVAVPCFWAMSDGKMRVTKKLQSAGSSAKGPARRGRRMNFQSRY
ncbi:hypothetical protein TWF106_005830 [Orbilia oligospora]|uniref:Uncharacterized protein n=1 Tax=Orbilia oligospora TaxID=2813651 RepID=A0A6G1M402_ORBOL|nr:hypothetical protein TWF679_007301 [Orbilia oligospora]KAF3222052.1 hypothetical protein TWF106_005830 [Orbilia oligospora]KAF3227754.1 hypothetical protein TWF191_003274 [Orbilia oligospora]KAF3244419.1 hypothetical protein TWF192_007711 [Orbilia oligospora]